MLDPHIVPNGRRDLFDHNAHFNSLLNHLAPATREISKQCRDSSIVRKLHRDYVLNANAAKEQISILKQGTLGTAKRKSAETEAREAIASMSKTAQKLVKLEEFPELSPSPESLTKKLHAVLGAEPSETDPLARLPAAKRKMYKHLFELIYDSSVNRSAAKSLIDRILLKIT